MATFSKYTFTFYRSQSQNLWCPQWDKKVKCKRFKLIELCINHLKCWKYDTKELVFRKRERKVPFPVFYGAKMQSLTIFLVKVKETEVEERLSLLRTSRCLSLCKLLWRRWFWLVTRIWINIKMNTKSPVKPVKKLQNGHCIWT